MWLSKTNMARFALRATKYITIRRARNLLLLVLSFYISRITKKPHIQGRPWAMSVEPSGLCNLQCPECPVGAGVLTRKGGMLEPGLLSKMLDEAGPELMTLNLYFQGEPMLNRKINKLITAASERNIFSSMSTNGHFLSPENCDKLIEAGLSELIISLDGISRQSYSRYRKGGNLDKVLQGIESMVKRRKELNKHKPLITVQFIVFEHNEQEIPELKKLCRQLGVERLQLKSAQFYDFGNNEVKPPKNPHYSRYVEKDGQPVLKGKSYNHCFKQWGSAVMSWDGRVAPCCYDKDLDFSPGNVSETPLGEIWKNQSLMQFRGKILRDKAAIAMCRNCPQGRKFLI